MSLDHETTLPRVSARGMGEVLTEMSVGAGVALQTKCVEVQATVSLRGSEASIAAPGDQSVQIDSFQQRGMGVVRFDLLQVYDNGAMTVDCKKTHFAFGQRKSYNHQVSRLVLDKDDRLAWLTEESSYYAELQRRTITPVDRPAGASILAMANPLYREARVPSTGPDPDMFTVSQDGESCLYVQASEAVSLIGKLMVTGAANLARHHNPGVQAAVDMQIDCGTYGCPLFSDNKMTFRVGNRSAQAGAIFDIVFDKPESYKHPSRVQCSLELIGSTPEGYPTRTIHLLGQRGGEVTQIVTRYSNNEQTSQEVRSASLGTAAAMAHHVARIAKLRAVQA